MLSDGEVASVRGWVEAADRWAHAAQQMVGTATDLATVSRDVAVVFEGSRRGLEAGAEDLRRLAVELEAETSALRGRYLETAANIEQYRDVLD